MSKNEPKQQHEIVGRRTWDISPVQKVIPNKKAYNRKRDKKVGSYE